MGRRKGQNISGWVNLDKPAGLTSTQAIGKVRRILDARKAGHAGTLDPLATGILPIALGEATKTIPYVQDALKTYSFTITWGENTNTNDNEGDVTDASDIRPSEQEIESALSKYTGHIEQVPPQFSAIKVNGERAYDLARDGKKVDLNPRPVFIESLKLLETTKDTAYFRMICGKGTYVRALARDLAADLRTCGHISALQRDRVGPFNLENAISLDILEEMSNSAALETAVLPLETALDDIPALSLKQEETARLKNGQALSFIAKPDFMRLTQAGLEAKDQSLDALAVYQNKPVALVEVTGPTVKPVRVLNI